MSLRESGVLAPFASLVDLLSAAFRGAPTPQAAEAYSARLTALISLYLCGVALFLLGAYVRAMKGRRDLTEERRTFKVWIAWSAIFAVLMIAAALVRFYFSVQL